MYLVNKDIKKLLLTVFSSILITSAVFGQAKKPTLMVVPSDNWCFQNNYMDTFDNQGTAERVPDYKLALQSDLDLINVISKINILMADHGFPLKNLESEIKDLNQSSAELAMVQGSGGEVAESPVDRLRRRAQADIIMQVTWSLNTIGPKHSITYNLQGIDAYTNKQIAGVQGTGAMSFATETPVLLEEAVMVNMDNFCAQLQAHFDDMMTNGREVSLRIHMYESANFDLESKFEGEELTEIIDNWMVDNTVNGRYSLTNSSENYIMFEQVRIPLYDEKGRAMDTNRFARGFRTFLGKAPYNISCKLMNNGLGRVTIILGDK